MYFRQIITSNDNNCTYLVGNPDTLTCSVIDPSYFVETAINQAKSDGYVITSILLTHTHLDHTPGIPKILAVFGDIPIYMSVLGQPVNEKKLDPLSPQVKGSIRYVGDGKNLLLHELPVQCISTPGHHPASMCYVINDEYLITGDTLFVDGIGRTDLYDGNPELLYQSLQKLKSLSRNLKICPGHDYGKNPIETLGEQLISNPYLFAKDSSDF